MKRTQAGYTLIELLIVLGILSLISGSIYGGIYQTITNTGKNSDHMTAVIHVQNAGNKIGNDVHMAQTIETVENLTDPNDFLFLSWIEASTGDKYEITYKMQSMDTGSMKKLMRVQSINDSDNSTAFVSQYINYSGDMTTCNFTDGIFNLTITASTGSGDAGTETRLYRIFPRPG